MFWILATKANTTLFCFGHFQLPFSCIRIDGWLNLHRPFSHEPNHYDTDPRFNGLWALWDSPGKNKKTRNLRPFPGRGGWVVFTVLFWERYVYIAIEIKWPICCKIWSIKWKVKNHPQKEVTWVLVTKKMRSEIVAWQFEGGRYAISSFEAREKTGIWSPTTTTTKSWDK